MGYFCAVWLFVGGILCLNLYVGYFLVEYEKVYTDARMTILTEDQERWVKIQKFIIREKFEYGLYRIPKNNFRKFLLRVVKSRTFDISMISCVFGNMVILAMTYDDDPPFYELILQDLNLCFTICFIVEFCVKIVALGASGYFFIGWNKFDFFLVATSILELILNSYLTIVFNFLQLGSQITRIFRILRIIRIFKLVKSFTFLKKLALTVEFILPSVFLVLTLLALVYYFASILASQLFAGM